MITITDIRKAANRLYGENKWNLLHDYKVINHRDGKQSKTGAKIYSMDNGKHWMMGKELHAKLVAVAEKLGR